MYIYMLQGSECWIVWNNPICSDPHKKKRASDCFSLWSSQRKRLSNCKNLTCCNNSQSIRVYAQWSIGFSQTWAMAIRPMAKATTTFRACWILIAMAHALMDGLFSLRNNASVIPKLAARCGLWTITWLLSVLVPKVRQFFDTCTSENSNVYHPSSLIQCIQRKQ